MQARLVSLLSKLKKDHAIQTYNIAFSEEKLSNTRSEVQCNLEVNGTHIASVSKLYNPEVQSFGRVSDILQDELTILLFRSGIANLMQIRSKQVEAGLWE